MERIEADVLIPGRGEPIRNGCVVIDGPTIAYAGPIEGAPKAPQTLASSACPPSCRGCGTAMAI
ncbi:MAG TPA: hypothetical protein VEM77_09180 [Thermoplasmata archaeon]|nr:hypothetical protein [Thermoplasmata archaeon]